MENPPFDAYSPRQIAERVEAACVAKAATPLRTLAMLGVLAGAFIGLGALYSVIVLSDASLGVAAAAGARPDLSWLWTNLVPVIAGNIVGGSVLVALVYSVSYRRPAPRNPR